MEERVEHKGRSHYFTLGDAHYSIEGDYDLAMVHLHFARSLAYQIDLVNEQEISHLKLKRVLDDGTVILCQLNSGRKDVTIIIPEWEDSVTGGEEEEEKEEYEEEDILIPLVKLYDAPQGEAVGWAVFYEGVLDRDQVLFLPWDFDTEPDPTQLTTVDIGVNLEDLASRVADARGESELHARCENMLQGSEAPTSYAYTVHDYDQEYVIPDPWDYPPLPGQQTEEQFVLQRVFDEQHADRLNCDSEDGAPDRGWMSSFNWLRNIDTYRKNRVETIAIYDSEAEEDLKLHDKDLGTLLEMNRTDYTGLHMLYDMGAYDEDYPGSQRLTDPTWDYYSPDYRFDYDTMGTSHWKEGYSNDTNKQMSLVGAMFDYSVSTYNYSEPGYHIPMLTSSTADCTADGSFICIVYDQMQLVRAQSTDIRRNDWYCDRNIMYWGYINDIVNLSSGVDLCGSGWNPPEAFYTHKYKLSCLCKIDQEQLMFDLPLELTTTETDTNYNLLWEEVRYINNASNHLFRLGMEVDYKEYEAREQLATIGDVGIFLDKSTCPGDEWYGPDHGGLYFFKETEAIDEESNPSTLIFPIPLEERTNPAVQGIEAAYPKIVINDEDYYFQLYAASHFNEEYYPEGVNDHCSKWATTQRFVARYILEQYN